jgi:shikimate kinase
VEIEQRDGRSIKQLIDEEGEERFRGIEAELTEEFSRERYLILSPGGGWITRPELLDAIRPGTLAVWLQVSPEETTRRLMEDSIDRPFKDHPNPVEQIAAMQSEREPLFRLADITVPANARSVEEIAFEIEQLARTRGLLEPEERGG